MDRHGIARSNRPRTEEQRLQELEKIKKYRDLEHQVRIYAKEPYRPRAFELTSKLLKVNPEYYTVWNIRRRFLVSGLLSKQSNGPSLSSLASDPGLPAATINSSMTSGQPLSTGIRASLSIHTAGGGGTAAGGLAHAEELGDPSVPGDVEKDEDILRLELGFTMPLLMQHPKCYWLWSHRLWTLRQTVDRLCVQVARRIWDEELGLVSKMLSKDRRNFHAWGYRRQIIKQLEILHGNSLVGSEFEYTSKMIRVDLSNFSAWHSRSKLIPRLLDERGADHSSRKKFLDDELNLIREALNVGPEDQSLWYYHQYLVLDVIGNCRCNTVVPGLSQEDRASYVLREIEGVKDLLEDYDDVQWLYEAMIEYTVSLCQLQGRDCKEEERASLRGWLERLKVLDRMRADRWNDMGTELGLS